MSAASLVSESPSWRSQSWDRVVIVFSVSGWLRAGRCREGGGRGRKGKGDMWAEKDSKVLKQTTAYRVSKIVFLRFRIFNNYISLTLLNRFFQKILLWTKRSNLWKFPISNCQIFVSYFTDKLATNSYFLITNIKSIIWCY